MQSITQTYSTNVGNYLAPNNDSFGENDISPYSQGKILEANSLQEKVNVLSAQVRNRRKLSERFERESIARINQLIQEKVTMEYFKQDTSGIEDNIRRLRISIQGEKNKAWKDVRELEIEIAEVELELNKTKVRNSMTYKNDVPLYKSTVC